MLVGPVALLYHMTSYYSLRGGNSNEGLTCGIWMTFLRTGTSDIRWYIGDALSLLHIMLIVVVVQDLVLLVVHFLLLH